MDTDTRVNYGVYFLGGALVTFVAFVAAHQSYPALCGLDGTVFATWALVAVGGLSATAAFVAYRYGVRDKRIDRTLQLVFSWNELQGNSASPDDCYTYLNYTYRGDMTLVASLTPGGDEYRRMKSSFITLHNYFDGARIMGLYRLIDPQIFYTHQQNIIRDNWTVLKPYYTFFEAKEGFTPFKALPGMVADLDNAVKPRRSVPK